MSPRTLVTFPGKIGDCLWAMASMKEIAKRQGKGIAVALSPYLKPLQRLLMLQDWVQECMILPDWQVEFNAPVTPRIPPSIPDGYDVIHLGLEHWPDPTLPQAFARIVDVYPDGTPWISAPWTSCLSGTGTPCIVWTDEWVELKVGLIAALVRAIPSQFTLLTHPRARLGTEFTFPPAIKVCCVDIYNMACYLGQTPLLITDKSMARVLAYGMGTGTLVVEPSEPRHNPVFDPPTQWRQDLAVLNGFDAREVVQLVGEYL